MRHLSASRRAFTGTGVPARRARLQLHAVQPPGGGGSPQLERLDHSSTAAEIAARYVAGLGAVPVSLPAEADGSESNYWLMSVLVDNAPGARDRHELMSALRTVNIEARPFFTPLPLIGAFAHDGIGADVPVSQGIHARGLSIPSSAGLDADQQARVIDVLTGRA